MVHIIRMGIPKGIYSIYLGKPSLILWESRFVWESQSSLWMVWDSHTKRLSCVVLQSTFFFLLPRQEFGSRSGTFPVWHQSWGRDRPPETCDSFFYDLLSFIRIFYTFLNFVCDKSSRKTTSTRITLLSNASNDFIRL